MEGEVNVEDNDPLIKLYLPSKIASSHTCCSGIDENNNALSLTDSNNNGNVIDMDDEVNIALTYFENEEYAEASKIVS